MGKKIPDWYYQIRDFEYAQSIYDLAYLLEIGALAKNKDIPKYRISSLRRAAYKIDGYSTLINQWLANKDKNNNLDYIPSTRIRKYLETFHSSDNQGILKRIDPLEEGCLRSRSLKGIRKKQLTRILGENKLTDDTIRDISHNTNRLPGKVVSIFNGNDYGQWQTGHVVPPLIRFLRSIECSTVKRPKWKISGITDSVTPITSPFSVEICSKKLKIDNLPIDRIAEKNPFFKIIAISKQRYIIKHIMGWFFELLSSYETTTSHTLHDIAHKLDPLIHKLPSWINADLHVHSIWSDGNTSLIDIIRAAKKNGLNYIAITDHSRSSKFQGGLKPSSWLRQSMSISKLRTRYDILHGLEVDILKSEYIIGYRISRNKHRWSDKCC